jgi:hypothetical protein
VGITERKFIPVTQRAIFLAFIFKRNTPIPEYKKEIIISPNTKKIHAICPIAIHLNFVVLK